MKHMIFKLKKIGPVAYRLELPEELSSIHNTFHVSNLKKCLSDESLVIPMKELQIDDVLAADFWLKALLTGECLAVLIDAAALGEFCLAALTGTCPNFVATAVGTKFLLECG
ncbi:hypothetical protein Tco_1431628 [Tanacetum coccineum]